MFLYISPPNRSENTTTKPGGVWINMDFISEIKQIHYGAGHEDPIQLLVRVGESQHYVNKDSAGPGVVDKVLAWLRKNGIFADSEELEKVERTYRHKRKQELEEASA